VRRLFPAIIQELSKTQAAHGNILNSNQQLANGN